MAINFCTTQTQERSYWAQMAKDHWEKYLPKKYNRLKQEGILEQELEKAATQAVDMAWELTQSGMYRHEIMEIILPQFILLPPEPKDQTEIDQ